MATHRREYPVSFFALQQGGKTLWDRLTDPEADLCEEIALAYVDAHTKDQNSATCAWIYHAAFAGAAYGLLVDRVQQPTA